ncbi:3-keto-disaccharide hydrolase [Pedobacter sp.]|uniref:3-keto-disaccharide hydrolase n=1 Tax=Pedobacter sp. TaxID=1411316 RepID=UPI003D7F7506
MKLNTAIITTTLLCSSLGATFAQEKAKPEDTEFYTPVPKVVTPGKAIGEAPSDAIILFDGKNLDQWVSTNDRSKKAPWTVANGVFTVDKKTGNIETKQSFNNYQLHLEWQVPAKISGKGQGRGNSGLFLASIGKGDDGYELQILDAYDNPTYTNGMAGSIYKQTTPLVNPARKPGEWQTYDIIWMAPTFNDDGSVKTPARVTAFFNGVLIQNNFELKGPTQYIGQAAYRKAHGPSPIKLQSHGDPSEPLSFRNIWIREL